MASNKNFLKAATIHYQAASVHGLKQRFHPSCNYSWPLAKISYKLQLFMASSQDFFQAATIHGLRPRFPPSCNYKWPKDNFFSKLQVFMA
jgi:hypothetical protein